MNDSRPEPGHGVAVWSSGSWKQLATSWLDERLADAGISRTGEIEQSHLRPWSTVLKVPTSAGTVWLKATGPDVIFEARLYELLERVVPDRILVPLAVDVTRGWILLPDGGPPLGERASGAELVNALARALPAYGQLQRDLAPHAGELLALGVTDMRPEVMPRRFDEALEAMHGYVERRDIDSEHTAYEVVTGMRDTVGSWCEQLAGTPVTSSIDHNDLHPWNILVGDGDGAQQVRFYDWGDSVVAHPFATMLALGFVPMDDGDVERLRDSYLEVFSDLGSHGELVDALELACRVGKVARALTWHRAISAGDPNEVEEDWTAAPIESMTSLLDDSYLGRA